MTQPFGTWRSPLPAAVVAAQGLRLSSVAIDGDDVYWIEGRAAEGGRNVIVRLTGDGRTSDVVPPGFNARSRVHEYGGTAYAVADGVLYFSNFSDQRIYAIPVASPAGGGGPTAAYAGVPVPLTPDGPWRYADFAIDPSRRRLIAVREEHPPSGTPGEPMRSAAEPVNAIVAIPLGGGSAGDLLASGHDFYSTPRLSADGRHLAWLAWRHPQMPWDGTELWIADVGGEGALAGARQIAGGSG